MEYSKGVLVDDNPAFYETKEIARVAIRSALADYDISALPTDRLTVKSSLYGEIHTHDLCVASTTVSKDKVIASARVNQTTLEVVVQIMGLRKN